MKALRALLALALLASPALAERGKTCIKHSMAGKWPEKDGGEGNPWVFAKVDGRWYAATYEWLRPGQECKYVVPLDIGAHTKKAPLTGWAPAYGEQVGFMVSGYARSSDRNVEERSNVVLARWGVDQPGPDSGEDQLDLSQVTWLHHDVSGWKRSSKVEAVSFKGGDVHKLGGATLPPALARAVNGAVTGGQPTTYSYSYATTSSADDGPPGKTCLRHTMAGKWPSKDGGEGNPWVFARIGDQWYAATYEWLRPGQICKLITPFNVGAHTKKDPLRFWAPAYGEEIGFMTSGYARSSDRNVEERSNVVLARWGYDSDGPESGEDQVDLSKVIWLHADVSRWKRSSKLERVSFEGASSAPDAVTLR